MENKRKHERKQTKIKAEVHTESNMTFSTSADISTDGIFITTPEPIKVGETVTLELKINDEFIEVSGKVKWNRDEKDEEVKAGMGLEFIGIDPKDMEKINKL